MDDSDELREILEVVQSLRLEAFAIKDRIQALNNDLQDIEEAILKYLNKGR